MNSGIINNFIRGESLNKTLLFGFFLQALVIVGVVTNLLKQWPLDVDKEQNLILVIKSYLVGQVPYLYCLMYGLSKYKLL